MIADLAKYMKMVWQCLPIDLVGMCTAFDSVSVRSPPFAPKRSRAGATGYVYCTSK